jgi:23S rRNA (uracil1939-C5)-methyltransferase
MLRTGQTVELTVERPAAGGRMIARHDGQVVFVAGAIPGERVRARVAKADRQLAFAAVTDILEASADRRPAFTDPLCGGCAYSHINYGRQLSLKADVVADAFRRLGRLPVEDLAVAPSPETAYRMRARFHVSGGAIGFYREGSHEVCDARVTRQVSDDTTDAVAAIVHSLADSGAPAASIEITENVSAAERAAHIELGFDARASEPVLSLACAAGRLRGCTARTAGGILLRAGDPFVADPFHTLTEGRAASGELRRQAASFFQANRFMLPSLVTAVLDSVDPAGPILDLYAGVGLFSLSLAAIGRRDITAVEGDSASGADLRRNAEAFADAVRVVIGRVEDYVASARPGARTIVVDPPRTGISRDAMVAVAALEAPRVVYVSCDPPTMARDARRLTDAGYAMESLRAFDLFPNTPHVESLGVFRRV